jgi:hypothetical protein
MKKLVLLALVTGALFSSAVIAQDEVAPGNRPLPQEPNIAAASDEAERALAGFKIPAGLTGQLVAAEPMLANPVAL